jgi:HEAT repeat protein
MASIVKLVEKDVTESLTRELQSPAPRRRLAALQATQLLGCADDVSQILLPLLNDPRLEVRVRTIDLLGALGHESLETLIPELLQDASTDIQDAANRAVRRIQRAKRVTP